MIAQKGRDRPLLRGAHDKLDGILRDINRHPRLIPYENELRRVRDRMHAIASGAPSDVDMNTTVLDSMYSLVDEVAEMPIPIRTCVAISVFSYVGEQIIHYSSLKSARALTVEEKRFGKERLGGLLDRLQEIIDQGGQPSGGQPSGIGPISRVDADE